MSKLELLVVDDETDFAEFVADVAEDAGFKVLSTDDPRKFFELYSSKINIVVLDLFMPGIDGIELIRYLAEKKSKAAVILMSGKSESVLRAAQALAEEQNINVLASLQKPILPEDLEKVFAMYVPEQSSRYAAGVDELPSVDELRQAIDRHELFLVFQPQVKIANRALCGFEALLRWKHPDKGMISPGYFIPLAEENGLIADITTYTNKAAIGQLGAWEHEGLNTRVSINMSPLVLTDLGLPEQLTGQAEENGVDPSNIIIEVTETAATTDIAQYIDILTRLRMKGFGLSIDDFGTGYSSLQQLVRVPFSELKVDIAFIKKLLVDSECRSITEVSIMLAHKLGMTVVAEGVEDEATFNLLGELRCEEGQGYWIGKPMPAEEIESWRSGWDNQ